LVFRLELVVKKFPIFRVNFYELIKLLISALKIENSHNRRFLPLKLSNITELAPRQSENQRQLLSIALLHDLIDVLIQAIKPFNLFDIRRDYHHAQFFSTQVFLDFFQSYHVPFFGGSVDFLEFSLLRLGFPNKIQFFEFVKQIPDS
jgi:hypothetical protein